MIPCSIAAFLVIFDLDSSFTQVDIFAKACQILYEQGQSLSATNDILLGIQGIIKRNNIKIPGFVGKYLGNMSNTKRSKWMESMNVPLPNLPSIVSRAQEIEYLPNIKFSELIIGLEELDVGPD
jgi:hypothetical protein